MKQRQHRIQKHRQRLSFASANPEQLTLDLPITPDIQTSTMQVPIGPHSIFDALKNGEVTQAEAAFYLYRNEHSHWETGKTHALSHTDAAKFLGMQRSQVVALSNSLAAKGWCEKNRRDGNRANTYKLTHHKCEVHEVPLDKDGRPKKCAVPRGAGSPSEKLEKGIITWKQWLHWIISKVQSDWVSGIVSMTVKQACRLMRSSAQTICDIRKALAKVGLVERLSKRYTTFTAQLYPKPYPNRRRRRRENPKGMRFDGEYYYSFNERWRISREDYSINTRLEGTEKWRHANERELEEANEKIYRDFMKLRKNLEQIDAAVRSLRPLPESEPEPQLL